MPEDRQLLLGIQTIAKKMSKLNDATMPSEEYTWYFKFRKYCYTLKYVSLQSINTTFENVTRALTGGQYHWTSILKHYN